MGAPVLDVLDNAVLGANLIQSGALAEAGFAAVMQTEAEKIELLLAAFEAETPDVTIATILDANLQLQNILTAVLGVEEVILQKIILGLFLRGEVDASRI